MEINSALASLNALSHETRLWVLCLLAQAGQDGLAAGDIADSLNARQNTMSSHLNKLADAGLITRHRQGRSIIYRASFASIDGLIRFLGEECCAAWED